MTNPARVRVRSIVLRSRPHQLRRGINKLVCESRHSSGEVGRRLREFTVPKQYVIGRLSREQVAVSGRMWFNPAGYERDMFNGTNLSSISNRKVTDSIACKRKVYYGNSRDCSRDARTRTGLDQTYLTRSLVYK